MAPKTNELRSTRILERILATYGQSQNKQYLGRTEIPTRVDDSNEDQPNLLFILLK